MPRDLTEKRRLTVRSSSPRGMWNEARTSSSQSLKWVRVVQEGLGENEQAHGYRYCP